MRNGVRLLTLLMAAVAAGSGVAQAASPQMLTPPGGDSRARAADTAGQEPQGITPPDTDTFRMSLEFMAAWMQDPANASLGFEKQGRIGYVILGLSGTLNDAFRYRVEVNPVNETQPLGACGETNYFFPNAVSLLQGVGPNVPCVADGRMRVDDYRYVALDPVRQQGPIRQAYLEYTGSSFGMKFGRFILPIGIAWQETGGFTAKDIPHIARINTEANFGAQLEWKRGTVARLDVAAVLGDGNRFHDYDYYYLIDGSMDSNSALTGLVSGSVRPIKTLEFRGAYKFGYTGSKVERLPNFFASKRNDRAAVASVRYTPNAAVTVFAEYARYTWGLTATSAQMLGLDQAPVIKPGYYVGAEGSYPVGTFRIGGSFVFEELSRDDSLVTLMAGQGLYRAELGTHERNTIYRAFVAIPGGVRVGWFYNAHSNPLPQLSAIVAVAGPTAYVNSKGSARTGIAVQFRIP